jgi:hypothetical protein
MPTRARTTIATNSLRTNPRSQLSAQLSMTATHKHARPLLTDSTIAVGLRQHVQRRQLTGDCLPACNAVMAVCSQSSSDIAYHLYHDRS